MRTMGILNYFVNNKAFNGYLGLKKMYKRKVIRKISIRAIIT